MQVDTLTNGEHRIQLTDTEARILAHVLGRGSFYGSTLDNLFDRIADSIDAVAGSAQMYSQPPTWLTEIGDRFFENERRLARSGY